jgi:hypothetical protein
MRHPTHLARRLLPAVAVALLGMAACAGGARALEACRGGEFSASPLRPLPSPAVIGVDVTDNSAENAGLAAAFSRGMSNAGAQVPAGGAATVAMRLSWQVLNPGGGGGGGNGGGQSGGGGGQGYMQGGIAREAPVIPDQGLISGRQAIQPGLLVFRAEARDPSGATIFWIGSVQCTLTNGETDKLLYQLGQLIGGAIGQRRDHQAM